MNWQDQQMAQAAAQATDRLGQWPYPRCSFGFWESLFGVAGGIGASRAPDMSFVDYWFQEREPVPDEDGWYDWMRDYPPFNKLLIVWREGWEKPAVLFRDELSPMTNVSGLKWKLTGITKETA